ARIARRRHGWIRLGIVVGVSDSDSESDGAPGRRRVRGRRAGLPLRLPSDPPGAPKKAPQPLGLEPVDLGSVGAPPCDSAAGMPPAFAGLPMCLLAAGSMASGALAEEGAASGSRRFLARAQGEGQECGSSGSDGHFYGDCSVGLECVPPADGAASGSPGVCRRVCGSFGAGGDHVNGTCGAGQNCSGRAATPCREGAGGCYMYCDSAGGRPAQGEGQECGSSSSGDFFGGCSSGLACVAPAAGSPSGAPSTCQRAGQQEAPLLAGAARPTAWFVTRQRCGGGGPLMRLWAGQCQPAKWDRGLSVMYTCGGDVRNSDANLTQVVYGDAVCGGAPLRTKTMRPGECTGFPDMDGEASWFCKCGFQPSGGAGPLTNYQSC
ncbi:unnamed protein product, partial [Prorocentrum cordatum]